MLTHSIQLTNQTQTQLILHLTTKLYVCLTKANDHLARPPSSVFILDLACLAKSLNRSRNTPKLPWHSAHTVYSSPDSLMHCFDKSSTIALPINYVNSFSCHLCALSSICSPIRSSASRCVLMQLPQTM